MSAVSGKFIALIFKGSELSFFRKNSFLDSTILCARNFLSQLDITWQSEYNLLSKYSANSQVFYKNQHFGGKIKLIWM